MRLGFIRDGSKILVDWSRSISEVGRFLKTN